MFKLVVSDKVRFSVNGFFTGDDGRDHAFDFHLIARRESPEELEKLASGNSAEEASVRDYLAERIVGWDGVTDPDGAAIPFSAEKLRELMFVLPGIPQLCFRSYLKALAVRGGKEKN